MMNILFVNNLPFNPALGGIERVTDTLAKEFKRKGYHVYYLCNMCPQPDMLEYDFPVPQNFIPSGQLFATSEDIKFYQQFIKNNNIDIVINQRGSYSFGNFVLNTGRNNTKLISVIHTKPLENYTTLRYSFFSSSTDWKSGMKNVIKFFTYPISYFWVKRKILLSFNKHYKTLFSFSDKIVLLSDSFRKELYLVHPENEEKIIAIPNVNSFPIQKINYALKKKQILFVGRFTRYDKRVDRLIKIWQYIYKNNPDWELVLVGSGKEEKNLKKSVRSRNIKRVRFEGYQKNTQPYFEQAAIVCLTSSFEGFPMVLGEAMAMGCVPVAFSSYESITDIIDHQKNGILIKPFDLKAYADALEKLMCDNSYRLSLAADAQKKVNEFSIEKVVNKWESLFKEVTDVSKSIYNNSSI